MGQGTLSGPGDTQRVRGHSVGQGTPSGPGDTEWSGDTHCGVGAGEEHAEAEEPQERAPHHAEDADGCLRGHGLQHPPCAPGKARAGGPCPIWGPAAPCLPAAQVPAWRTRTPSPGTAARNRELGRGAGCHGGAGDPPMCQPRGCPYPLTQQLGEQRGPRLRQPGQVRPHQVLHGHRGQRVEG